VTLALFPVEEERATVELAAPTAFEARKLARELDLPHRRERLWIAFGLHLGPRTMPRSPSAAPSSWRNGWPTASAPGWSWPRRRRQYGAAAPFVSWPRHRRIALSETSHPWPSSSSARTAERAGTIGGQARGRLPSSPSS